MARETAKSLLPVTLLAVLLVGCGPLLLSYKGALVRPENQIPLAEGVKQTGSFQTQDLTVAYSYSRTQNDLQLAGSIRFDDSLQYNFTSLRNFRLGAFFLDSQGHILADRGIESKPFGYPDSQATFDVHLQLPEGTTSMAFSYSGEARQHGSNGATQAIFWHEPVMR